MRTLAFTTALALVTGLVTGCAEVDVPLDSITGLESAEEVAHALAQAAESKYVEREVEHPLLRTRTAGRVEIVGAGDTRDLGVETVAVALTDPRSVGWLDAELRRITEAEGKGPALLDVECYRTGGHSTTDANVYRTKEELAAWEPVGAATGFDRPVSG